jgi:putative transposase
LALLAAVGVDEEGFREVLLVEAAGSEKSEAYASLLRGLIDRGLCSTRSLPICRTAFRRRPTGSIL